MSIKSKKLKLLLITIDSDCLDWVNRAFAEDSKIRIQLFKYSDFEDCVRARGEFPEVDILLIDLDRTCESPIRFWVLARMLYDQTPVVAITKPKMHNPLIWGALHARADQFICLASSEAELRDRVKRALMRQTSLGYAPATLDAITALYNHPDIIQLRLASREAIVGVRTIRLTALETKLLEYLVKHKRRSVSWVELLVDVWNCPVEAGGTQDQVKSCVKRLRQKIEPIPQHPHFLLSAREQGYTVSGVEVVPKN